MKRKKQIEPENKAKSRSSNRLYVLRDKAIMAGVKLLSEEGIFEEVRRRRGEVATERQ